MVRNRFWAFMCALVPGAGQMYMGYMKRGLSLMVLFFGACFGFSVVSGLFYMFDGVFSLIPVVWFYSFFDALNLQAKLRSGGEAETDDWLLSAPREFSWNHRLIGYVLIVLGVLALYINLVVPFLREFFVLDLWASQLVQKAPSVVIFGLMIFAGIRMIIGTQRGRGKGE